MPSSRASLVVVGSGMRLGQATIEAVEAIRHADRVLYITGDPLTERWVQQLTSRAESLDGCYAPGRPRARTYREMVDRILARLRSGERVCALFYGHPGVGVTPSHAAIAAARREGFPARMMPGVSAEACLVADLGLDPVGSGWQAYEASAFLAARPRVDTRRPLVLWQVGVVGEESVSPSCRPAPAAVRHLTRALRRRYPARHKVTLYEVSFFPICAPRIERVAVERLPDADLSYATTMYVPPIGRR